MYNYDYFTGEPSSGSPPQSELSEQEIAANANLAGAYYTDPNQRMQQVYPAQQAMYFPGGTGYNDYSQTYYGGYMNPPQQQSGFSGFAGNPAFAYMQANGMRPAYQDYTRFIPGFNPGNSDMILRSDAEEVCAELQMQMFQEQEEAMVARRKKNQSYMNSMGYGYNGFNYYGNPYTNYNYYDPSITNKYRQKVEQMKEEARQTRVNFNKGLSRLCRYYLSNGGEVDEKEIDEIYSGHYVTIPGVQMEAAYEESKFSNLVEIDTSQKYKQYDAEASQIYRSCMSDDTDMMTFFHDVGQVISAEKAEEELHRRRDLSENYESNSYKALIREKIKNKYRENGGQTTTFTHGQLNQQNNEVKENIPLGQFFPALNEAAKMTDDGTMTITTPDWVKNSSGMSQYTVKNENEDIYELNRGRFIQSVYRDNPRPSGPPLQQVGGGDNRGG